MSHHLCKMLLFFSLANIKWNFPSRSLILRNIPVLAGKLSALLLDTARLGMCFPSRARGGASAAPSYLERSLVLHEVKLKYYNELGCACFRFSTHRLQLLQGTLWWSGAEKVTPGARKGSVLGYFFLLQPSSHPHICAFHIFSKLNSNPFVVMLQNNKGGA